MTTPAGSPRYRLRVHDGSPATLAAFEAGTGGNALSFTSLRRDADTGASSGPYIESAPQTAAATVDLVTGHSSVGATTIRVLDAGASPTGTTPGTIIDPATGLPAVRAAADYFDQVHGAPNDGTYSLVGAGWSDAAAIYHGLFNGPAGGEDGTDSLGFGCEFAFGHPTGQILDFAVAQRTFTPTDFPVLQPSTTYTVRVRGRITLGGSGLIGVLGEPSKFGLVVSGGTSNADLDYLYDGPNPDTTPWRTYQAVVESDASGHINVGLGITTINGDVSFFVQLFFDFDSLEIYPGSPATPGGVVTTHLSDDTGCSLLLSRRAVIEVADESDCTDVAGVFTYANPLTAPSYRQLQSGYVNRYHLDDALVWEFTVGDTRREEYQESAR